MQGELTSSKLIQKKKNYFLTSRATFLTSCAIVTSLCTAPTLLFAAPNDTPTKPVLKTEQPKASPFPPATLPIEEIRTFVDIFDRIKQAYVEPVDDKTLLNNAIKGMLSELDPHSAYLDPEAFSDLEVNTTGEFGGLGIEVGLEGGFIKVITPIDDTPAQKAGIQTGDLIIKLNNKPIKGMSLEEAVNMMRGKPGTDIEITVMRQAVNHPLAFKLKRAVIQVKSVKQSILEPGYGYIRLAQFQLNTGNELANALAKVKKETVLKGIILDLRNNPGGILQSAVDVVDAFINKGLVVYTQGRIKNAEARYEATDGDLINGIPMIVLINSGSASASEIVAGALQDHKRAVVIGTRSFGKGSVQTVLPIGNDRALKLTTARYYTPNGRSIQAQGIMPDIVVETAKLTDVGNDNVSYRESDLTRHLINESGENTEDAVKNNADKDSKGTQTNNEKEKNSTGKKSLAEEDYQLYEALSLLKGITLSYKK